jgi:hypothetical protein
VRERKNTAIEEKESYRWLAALQETVEGTPAPPTVITLWEREADSSEFLAAARRWDATCVIRAAWDRHLKHEDYPCLWPLVEAQAVAGHVSIHLPAREKRKARTARLALRFTTVTLAPPQRHRTAVPDPLPPLPLYAVHVKELEPPPGETAVEWMLLTNMPVHTFDDALQRVVWYGSRWQVE